MKLPDDSEIPRFLLCEILRFEVHIFLILIDFDKKGEELIISIS